MGSNIMLKFACIETIEVEEILNLNRKSYSMRFYHYKADGSDKLALDTFLPIELDGLSEIRGLLMGLEAILGIELYVTEIKDSIIRLDAWTKISRNHLRVCYREKQFLSPKNFPDDIFLTETEMKFLGSN